MYVLIIPTTNFDCSIAPPSLLHFSDLSLVSAYYLMILDHSVVLLQFNYVLIMIADNSQLAIAIIIKFVVILLLYIYL